MNIQEAIDLSLESQVGILSNNTIRTYGTGLRRFLIYLKEYDLSPSDPLEKINMSIFVHSPTWFLKNYAKSTASVYWHGVRSFYEWMVLEYHIEPTPSEQLRLEANAKKINRKQESKLPRFPEEEDVDRMLAAAREMDNESPIYERNIALVELLASSGCRINEVCTLKIMDIDSKMRYAIVNGKGNHERRVFINDRARAALKKYWKVRGFSGRPHPVFARHDKGVGKGKKFKIKPISTRTADNIVGKIAMQAGLEIFTPHYFRHAFAIKALHESGNLALVQDLLGHATPNTTRIYAKIRPADLEAAHRQIFG